MISGEKVEITEVHKDDKKQDIYKSWKIIIGTISLLSIVVLIFYKVNNPNFNIITLGLIILLIIAFFLGVFYFFKLKNKLGKFLEEEKKEIFLPKPVSREILLEKLHMEAFTNQEYMNHIEEVEDAWSEDINGNEIHCFKVKVVYFNPGENQIRYVIYNANYPNKLPSILKDPSVYEIRRAMNKKSMQPIDDPDTERRIERNPLLGTETEIIRKTKQKKEEKIKPKKSEEFTEE